MINCKISLMFVRVINCVLFQNDSFYPDSNKRGSVLQWHPETTTQLVVASDDDSSPSLKVMPFCIVMHIFVIDYFLRVL